MREAPATQSAKSLLPPPIKLADIRVNGFAAACAYAGEQLPVLTRAELISDQPEFHIYMREITNLLEGHVRKATGGHLQVEQIAAFVLVTHEEGTAELYLQQIPRVVEMLSKRAIAAGEMVYLSSIADVRRLRIPGLALQPKDGVIICFKVGWKFALFFDLGPGRSIGVDAMERSLGSLYRYLTFEAVYAALGDPVLVERLTRSGWFPFIEILGGEFERLLKAYQLNFDVAGQEELLLKAFDVARIDAIAKGWSKNPRLAGRMAILEPALRAFKECEPVASLKIILTEIEGIIQEAHIAELGKGAPIKKLLEYAAEKGVKKTGSDTSLFFPKPFLEYLSNYTYAHFDPKNPQKDVMSRHSVGHGGADATAYTPQRALQAILTLDQIAFYLMGA
jgi:hypothetical protein